MFIIINIKLVKLCEGELTNKHIQNAIVVKSKRQQMIGHVPEALASKPFTLMQELKIYKVFMRSHI